MASAKEVAADLALVRAYQKDITLLAHASALLGWDQQTYMPHYGVHSRAEQSAYLSKLIHEKFTNASFFAAVRRLRNAKLTGNNALMVEKLYKEITRARKLPKEYVEQLSRATTLGNKAWKDARDAKNFGIFRPHLEKIVKLKREQARLIGLPGHPYNSLLDSFEEGMTVEKLKPIFETLKQDLVGLLRRIKQTKTFKKQKKVLMKQRFDEQAMRALVEDVAGRIGLAKERSRIDLSEHPFTTKVGAGDVRLTTAFRGDPMFSFGSTIHEAGHALYELGMPEKEAYTVLGDSPSLGLHESQSRFWENMIGKNKSFWQFYFPRFKKQFKLRGTLDQWYKEDNFVTPGMIRVEADEVHYCLHIILRFELETGLIDGSIAVKDLPRLWNEKMKELFGVKPKNDVEGVLQDIHWSWGEFGYFPTYAIGTMYAAQLYYALKQQYSSIENMIAKGNYKTIREWLLNHVHKHGSKYFAEDVIKKTTGSGLDPDIYVSYLNKKYSEIYGF